MVTARLVLMASTFHGSLYLSFCFVSSSSFLSLLYFFYMYLWSVHLSRIPKCNEWCKRMRNPVSVKLDFFPGESDSSPCGLPHLLPNPVKLSISLSHPPSLCFGLPLGLAEGSGRNCERKSAVDATRQRRREEGEKRGRKCPPPPRELKW